MFDIEKHLVALSQGKWSEYKAALANDAVYDEVATQTRVKGADEYVAAIQRWKKAFPDLEARVLKVIGGGDKVFAELEWKGTQTGPLEGPFGVIAPTNKHGVIRAAIVAEIRNDKISELRHYFDVLSMLRNLGVAPSVPMPSGAEKRTAPITRH